MVLCRVAFFALLCSVAGCVWCVVGRLFLPKKVGMPRYILIMFRNIMEHYDNVPRYTKRINGFYWINPLVLHFEKNCALLLLRIELTMGNFIFLFHHSVFVMTLNGNPAVSTRVTPDATPPVPQLPFT